MCVCICVRMVPFRRTPQVSTPGRAPACVGRAHTRDGACLCGGRDARPAAPDGTRHLLPAPLGHLQPTGSPRGCAAAALGMLCSRRAGSSPRERVRSVTPPLLQPLRGQSHSRRRSGRVLLTICNVTLGSWQAVHRVPPARHCAPGSTGLEIPLVSRVGNQTGPGMAAGTAKRLGTER